MLMRSIARAASMVSLLRVELEWAVVEAKTRYIRRIVAACTMNLVFAIKGSFRSEFPSPSGGGR